MLKQEIVRVVLSYQVQPPSGGCVLKLFVLILSVTVNTAAAFGRLCVETSEKRIKIRLSNAAAFGRLCVETLRLLVDWSKGKAAAFGRLCVETCGNEYVGQKLNAAAFGRLCVETVRRNPKLHKAHGSRLRAAVC